MNTSTTLDSLTNGISAAVAGSLDSGSQLIVNSSQNLHRTYMIAGKDTKPSALSRYRIHVIGQRDRSTATAIFTDYGVNSRGNASSSKVNIDLSELQSCITSISQFLLTGTQSA